MSETAQLTRPVVPQKQEGPTFDVLTPDGFKAFCRGLTTNQTECRARVAQAKVARDARYLLSLPQPQPMSDEERIAIDMEMHLDKTTLTGPYPQLDGYERRRQQSAIGMDMRAIRSQQ